MLEDRSCLVSRSYSKTYERKNSWVCMKIEIHQGKRPLESDGEEETEARKFPKQQTDAYESIDSTLTLLDLSTTSSTDQSSDQGDTGDCSDSSSLIHAIGRDNSISALIRSSRSDYGSIASLNRSFRDLIRSGLLYRLRRQNGVVEHWIYFSCQLLGWEAFDPARLKWMRLPTMTSDECFMFSDKESLGVGTELLVFGKVFLSHVIFRYSLLTNTWSSGMTMNFPRCLFGSASMGELAILAGGCDSFGKTLSVAELYNSERGTWEVLPDMNKPRKLCSAVFMDEKYYVIGGVGGSQSKVLTCGEEYNLQTRTWTEIPNMSPVRTRPATEGGMPVTAEAPPLVAVVNNELYAADYAEMEVRKYDKNRRVWETVGRLPERADSMNGWGLAFRACGDRLIVIGGPRAQGEGFIEINAWAPKDGPPQWNLLGRKQSALPTGNYSPSDHHLSILEEVLDAGFLAQSSLIRSYKRSFNGFSAYLTDQESQKIADFEGVVSVFPSRTLQPLPTRSWDFMGFPENVHRHSSLESNVIIGVIDTGIWPESESFSDKNFGPVPTKWKGACNGGKNFTCNNKLIGARFYDYYGAKLIVSARDTIGHGTHTASIAAGNHVKGASFYGLAQGTARGGVPSARIAAYRVCLPDVCSDEAILAAYDDAIADGVDIITISIGSKTAHNFETDSIAIGAFHAMERNILTVTGAGNSGNFLGTVGNVAPWMLVVAASNTDRRIIDKAVLGNGITLVGNAVNSFNLNGSSFPLITGRDASTICQGTVANRCTFGCLDKELVKGKIVVCSTTDGIDEVYRVGAVGSILLSDAIHNYSFVLPLPASVLSPQDVSLVEAYVKSTKNPRASILRSEETHDSEAPVVHYFSSRGPNRIIPEILKPDISAPGIAILAAYSPAASPSEVYEISKTSVKYSILSGTSMATPHVAGAAAYVKSFHPTWSSSAIQSSLITTAWQMDASKNLEAEFAFGAGHLDPAKAANPGLVYETSKDDYVKMLCTIGFDNSKLRIIAGGNGSCPTAEKLTPKDVNYPTMTTNVAENRPFTVSFPRTVTNVGLANSTYKANISSNSQINITVKPDILSFKSLTEKKTFRIVVTGKGFEKYRMESASLVWSDGVHSVRSPIVVYTDLLSSA